MKRFVILYMAIAFVLFGMCNVQSEELTTEKKADINKLFELTGTRQTGALLANQISQQIISSIQVNNPTLPAKTFDIIREETGKAISEITTQQGGLFDLLVEVYHRYLSLEEIRGLISFYETPLGKKFIEVSPGIAQESLAIGMAWGQKLQPILNQRIKDRLSNDGIKILS
jgi:hypothetical protein